MPESIIQIKSLPGIKRDGTKLEGDNYVDGQWVRFQRNLPRKIGGYRSINHYLSDVCRALNEVTQNGLTYVHAGSASKVERFYIDQSNNTSIITDRTPVADYTPDADNLWQFDIDSQLSGGVFSPLILAQVAPNIAQIDNADGGELFYGDLYGVAPLASITLPTGGSATGGLVALHPYTFFFGNDGYIGWSIPGDPTDLSGAGSGAVNVTSQKIVRGIPIRGGPTAAPSGIFWSTNGLVRASFIGGDPTFQFDTLSTEVSIMSPRAAIEYDGIFYWMDVSRFMAFNGVVRELPNDMNINFLFDNINFAARQKVFAVKVPRYGEIWWCVPLNGSDEPNHAIIYNVREGSWYDTPLPNGGRSAGLFTFSFRRPLMTDSVGMVQPVDYRITEEGDSRVTEDGSLRVTEDSGSTTYRLWIHEQGVDEIDGQNIQPIQSYFETSDISLPVQKGDNRALQVLTVEPDFVQVGDMSMTVMGRRNARSPEQNGVPQVFPDTATTVVEEVLYPKTQRRQLRFRFESNTLNGDYQMGTILVHVQPGDGTSRA